jgi:hypothetical protein
MMEEEQEATLDEENISVEERTPAAGCLHVGGGVSASKRSGDGALLKRERLLRRRPKVRPTIVFSGPLS